MVMPCFAKSTDTMYCQIGYVICLWTLTLISAITCPCAGAHSNKDTQATIVYSVQAFSYLCFINYQILFYCLHPAYWNIACYTPTSAYLLVEVLSWITCFLANPPFERHKQNAALPNIIPNKMSVDKLSVLLVLFRPKLMLYFVVTVKVRIRHLAIRSTGTKSMIS